MREIAEGFFVGASTAAHQVEGNNIHSDYWAMEQMEYTSFVEPSLAAVDHYNRYEEDIKMLAEAGLNAYRFSIEWARIEPEMDVWDEREVDHYRRVIACCRKNKVEPIVTLHHFTSPKWLICKGGWDNEMVVERFAKYARYITEQLGSELNYICTINEANMRLQIRAISERFMKMMKAKAAAAAKAAETAQTASGKTEKNELEGQVQVGLNLSNPMERMKLQAMENMKVFGTPQPHNFVSSCSDNGDLIVCKAHAAAREAIKSVNSDIKVGITLSLHDMQWIDGGKEKAEKEWDEEFAHYIPFIQDDDFFGLQNYTRSVYGPDGLVAPGNTCPVYGPDGLVSPEKSTRLTQMDYELYPEALEHVIRRVHSELPSVPIMVTENGVATTDDKERVEFIHAAMGGIKKCIADGLPVLGYCHWSLMDNFEWQKGYQMTFGLVAVDRTTQTRYPKESLSELGRYAK